MGPHLSIVVTARNDNHGHNMLYRMQHFVSGLIEQCKKHALAAELIIVEWNPPDGAKLADVLQLPVAMGPCTVRFIRVSYQVHAAFDHADKISLFQMMGKNVGIRRARGVFVLATNIDVLFSDTLMQFLKHRLQKGNLYRVDRLDVPATLPDTPVFNDILRFCSKNVFRINGKCGTRPVLKGAFWKWIKQMAQNFCQKIKQIMYYARKAAALRQNTLRKIVAVLHIWHSSATKFIGRRICFIGRRICALCPLNRRFLHTNASGDFTLLTKENWQKLRGYPEWAMYSWHLDSVLLYQARQHGIREIDLCRKCAIYHIDHEHGYSADRPNTLFDRLDAQGIPYLTNEDLKAIVTKLRITKEKVVYNDENWGLADKELEEFSIYTQTT